MFKLGSRSALVSLGVALCSPIAFAQSPPPEGPSKGTGLILMETEAYEALPERAPRMRGRLPELVDLSSFFPTPGNQGGQGSCVGWAVGYALKTYQEAYEIEVSNPPESYHFSPAFVFNSVKHGNSCTEGSLISDAMQFVATTGAVRERDFPYREDQCLPPSEDLKQTASEFSIKTFEKLQSANLEFKMREALANNKPVVVAMNVYDGFYEWRSDENYSPPEDASMKEFHAVTVVGYDENRGAFKIINSWGPEWGHNGFFWMDYDAREKMIVEAYVSTDNRYDDPASNQPGIILAENPRGSSGGTIAAASPAEDSEQNATIARLTSDDLASAVTGHVGRDSEGRTPSGYDYYPASVWLNLEPEQLEQIESAEYYFYHPTFFNPKRPVDDTNVFLATWKGYGCIENAEVKVLLKNGERLSAAFDLCQIWDRFHPGGVRKDGGRSGTQPLLEDEAFDEEFGREIREKKRFLKKGG